MDATERQEIRPQAGPQTTFLSTRADIAIYGGAAFGGKTWALTVEPLRHVDNPHFGAVFFRRTSPQITNEGGPWDEAEKIYPLIGASPRSATSSGRSRAGRGSATATSSTRRISTTGKAPRSRC
jgi:hypothetical protein